MIKIKYTKEAKNTIFDSVIIFKNKYGLYSIDFSVHNLPDHFFDGEITYTLYSYYTYRLEFIYDDNTSDIIEFSNYYGFIKFDKKIIGLTIHKFKDHQIIDFINNNFGYNIPLSCLRKDRYIMIINNELHEVKITDISYSLINKNQSFETLLKHFKNNTLSPLFEFHIEYKEGKDLNKLTCKYNDVIFTKCCMEFEDSEIILFKSLSLIYPKEIHNYNSQKQIDKILDSLYFTRNQITRQKDIIEKLWMISQNKRFINIHRDEMSSNKLEILMSERCIYTKKDLEKYKLI